MHHAFVLRCCLLISGVTLLTCTSLGAQEFPGGFLEQPGTAAPRPNLSASQIEALLPPRGAFTFPAPYSTTGIRLTNASDCGGANCVNYIGYSYWRNMNNHVGEDVMLILIGLDRSRGGAGPSLFTYNKNTDEVVNLGPLFDDADPLSWATGEGWYFSAGKPYELYLHQGAKLLRYDVVTHQKTTVFDAAALVGSGHYIWQVHSSSDDRVHSATLRDSATYDELGCMVYFEDAGRHEFYSSQGDFDECQIDKSGNWLLIKENVDGKNGEDNRIVDLRTGAERILLDSAGAAGHSDLGYGYMVAADNFDPDPNTVKLWDFEADVLDGVSVYHGTTWEIFAPAHVSHANASPAVSPSQQYACGSSVNRSSLAEANEVLCFPLDGSDDKALIVAPVMTDLDASGGGDSYGKAPKGNLDVTGNYFIWSSNLGGSRLDAFLVKVPGHLLTGSGGAPAPAPVTPTEPTPDPEPTEPTPTDETAAGIVWTDLVNAAVNGSTLTKTGGCDGCADARAASQQSITSGDGFLEFTVDDSARLRYVGLADGQGITAAGQIDFALRIQAGYVEVRENGVYRAATGLSAGDVLRIAVKGGSASYARNGQVFHTSSAAPAYPLRAHAILFSASSTVALARISAGTSSGSGTESPTPTPEPTSPDAGVTPGAPVAVSWADRVRAKVEGTTLIKRGGCDGCADAGARSQQEIGQNGGYLEFTVDEPTALRFVGLSTRQAVTAAGEIDFALRIQAGYAEVRENGTYRAAIDLNAGDVLRISVSGNTVTYLRNGTRFYTSGVTPAWPMRAYATLLSRRSSVSKASIAVNQ